MINIVGQVFGRLTVVTKISKVFVSCICTCGNKK